MNGEESGTTGEVLQIPPKNLDTSEENTVNLFTSTTVNEEILQERIIEPKNTEKLVDNMEIPPRNSVEAEARITPEYLEKLAENGEVAVSNIVNNEVMKIGVLQSSEPRESITYSEESEGKIIINFSNLEEGIQVSTVEPNKSGRIVVKPYRNDRLSEEITHINSTSKQSKETINIETENDVIENVTVKSYTDHEFIHDLMINSNTEHSDSNDSVLPRAKLTTIEITEILPGSEFSNSNGGNSNGSFAESIGSSQAKFEATSHQPTDSLNENINSFAKIGNSSQNSEDVDSDGLTDADVSEEELKATDTVSINSDTEPENDILIPDDEESSQENQPKPNSSKPIILKNVLVRGPNAESHKEIPTEIHEIVSEHESSEEKKEDQKISEESVPLRRSSRAIKRKRYTDDIENSDDFELEIQGVLRKKSGPILINNTKAFADLSVKAIKCHQGNKQKREHPIIFGETYSERQLPQKNTGYSVYSYQNNQKSYKGCNSNTSSLKTNTITNQIPSILPSLTDDMFVVEAPSFIVPYVYEKPSTVPFKEFVKVLGKELQEQRAKELDVLEKTKSTEITDRQNADKKVDEAIEKVDNSTEQKKEVQKDKRRVKDDDDASWDGESSTESEDDILSDEDKVSVIKDKDHSVVDLNTAANLSLSRLASNKSESYFDCSLGQFFTDIGYNIVQEYVQNDMLKQQARKLHREKKTGNCTKATETCIASLNKNLAQSKANNSSFAFTLKKCKLCSFKTESDLVLSHHLETPHMKNNMYRCNFCSFEVRNPHEILFHMEKVHSTSAKLARVPSVYQCGNCPFEDNFKGKLARHLISCLKKFKPEFNLTPPFDWEPPAKIPKISKSRSSIVSLYQQNTFNRGLPGNTMNRSLNFSNFAPGVTSTNRPRGRGPITMPQRLMPVHGLQTMSSSAMLKHSSPMPNISTYEPRLKAIHQPSISITPLPRQPQPTASPQTSNTKNSFVICEICDGYIKDLEQLRNHMQSIHRVKIHPKMMYNRPPLNCQKCQFRFFTDQGLERHLLGSHGLVTSSMQEAANQGKDAGRCPVCGRVYQWKLLNHVARDHNLTLKPAHLSYKCTVCTATFGMYKLFENHVYSAHSVVARRMMDKNKTTPSQTKTVTSSTTSLLKPLKINDEITIIPQPAKTVVSKDK